MAKSPAKVSTTIDTRGIRQYEHLVSAGLESGTSSSPVRKMFKRWAVRWRGFTERRFQNASRGDGTWKGLAASTKKARKGSSYSILRDTSALFGALSSRTAQGALEQHGDSVVIVGYNDSARHSGSITIGQLAAMHQLGKGNLPARKIVVEPDSETLDGMNDDTREALVEIAKKSDKL